MIEASETAKLIRDLQIELKAIKNEEERAKKLASLEAMYKDYMGEDRVISSLEIAELIKTRPPIPKINSGLKDLDGILGGFTKKQLVVIAAPTKNGKTSFCIELTCQMKEKNPMWLPFEEPAEELIQKFLDRGEAVPLFYTPEKMVRDTKSCLEWIEKKIIEAKAKFNSEIVFIDHLHFVVPFHTDRQDLVIGAAMRELKSLAKTWNVVIFIVCHLKKTKLDTNPDLEDLRDSSFIAQEADTVIMMWRKTERVNGMVVIGNEATISVQANRRTGKTGNFKMVFSNGRFYEPSEQHQADDVLDHWDKD